MSPSFTSFLLKCFGRLILFMELKLPPEFKLFDVTILTLNDFIFQSLAVAWRWSATGGLTPRTRTGAHRPARPRPMTILPQKGAGQTARRRATRTTRELTTFFDSLKLTSFRHCSANLLLTSCSRRKSSRRNAGFNLNSGDEPLRACGVEKWWRFSCQTRC